MIKKREKRTIGNIKYRKRIMNKKRGLEKTECQKRIQRKSAKKITELMVPYPDPQKRMKGIS